MVTLGYVGSMRGDTLALTLVATIFIFAPRDGRAFEGARAGTSAKACANGPLDRPRPGCAPPLLPSTGSTHQDCVARINQLRWECQCLPPLRRWKAGEKCATKHAKHDVDHGVHAGFDEVSCEPKGLAQNECPAWPSTAKVIDGCLQAMWDEGPGKRFSKHGHYVNMSNRRYESVACGFAKDAEGRVWSVQNFR